MTTTATTTTEISGPPSPHTIDWAKLRWLVIGDVFDHSSPEDAAWLRSDELIFPVVGCIKGMLAAQCTKVDAYRIQTLGERDEKKFGKAVALRARLHERLPEFRALASDWRRRKYPVPSRRSIVEAIRAHRDAARESPTGADRVLWAVLDEVDATAARPVDPAA